MLVNSVRWEVFVVDEVNCILLRHFCRIWPERLFQGLILIIFLFWFESSNSIASFELFCRCQFLEGRSLFLFQLNPQFDDPRIQPMQDQPLKAVYPKTWFHFRPSPLWVVELLIGHARMTKRWLNFHAFSKIYETVGIVNMKNTAFITFWVYSSIRTSGIHCIGQPQTFKEGQSDGAQ